MSALKILAILAGVFIISLNGAIAADQGTAPEKVSAGHQVIRVNYNTGINPANLTVNRGTTVIWINEAMGPVSIKFLNKEITAACENPVNFTKDDMGCFIAKKVPFGAVASICFIEKGTFKFQVTRPTRAITEVQKGVTEPAKMFEGTIIVE